ncbi:hypothetical protein MesoLj131a_13680 [Mesorhizobium sp. 131-2-1]|nr:hypothetical protein MesoLj131a_13680 [Mesorhizobium sp. 131-2-1]
MIVGARMRLHRAIVLRHGPLAANEECDQADGNDYGKYEHGRHEPTPREVATAAAAGEETGARANPRPGPQA